MSEPTQSLLVIGAGIAGVSAALEAAEAGVDHAQVAARLPAPRRELQQALGVFEAIEPVVEHSHEELGHDARGVASREELQGLLLLALPDQRLGLSPQAPLELSVELSSVASGLDSPVLLSGSGDGTGARSLLDKGAASVIISAQIEEEISQLDAEEAQEFLSEMGLEEAGLDRVIRAGYELLQLETYFTVGPKEARAWTIREGTLAPQAAGVIHGDFEKGFIRAETIAYDDFVSLGGEGPAKEAGKMRAEGKSYIVKDGDVLHFLFNT